MEGDPVVLDARCITKLQKDDVMVWKFESDVIAMIEGSKVLLYDTEDAKFKDKLQINAQTGDLTIRNTRTTHSGLYEVKITNITATTYRRFSVTVLDPIPTKVSVTAGEPAVLKHNIADIQRYDVIEWTFEDGKTPVARINKQNSQSLSYDENDERFRDRLELDQSGSLTITDSRTSDSGLYKLQVKGTNIGIKHRRFRVKVEEPGLHAGVIVLICVVVFALILVVVGICIRRNRQQSQY
ncbi:uncharacterized protein si:dkey-182g1.2 isoform X2 [Puntigrus tetrazona]|nr:uncharacterized protein si:dkey-182g1.2 isoform X2 [Puntigrus tetrazona]